MTSNTKYSTGAGTSVLLQDVEGRAAVVEGFDLAVNDGIVRQFCEAFKASNTAG